MISAGKVFIIKTAFFSLYYRVDMNSSFEKGTIINNRYIVKDLIGQGGMGYVYLVQDTLKAGSEIALKTIKGSMSDKNEHLDIFKLEFEIMTRLKHPNLVNVYNFGYDDQKDCYYITMEYLKGKTLKSLLMEDNVIDENRAVDIMVNLLRGLEFIHSRNIISRDVKPSNILVSDRSVKLMDFGISDIGSVDQKKIKGSLLYIAPEILVGEADHRIDIYSAGIVFLQMLTGKILYKETKATSILDIIKDEYVYLYNQSVALEALNDRKVKDIINRMIAYNKEERYNTCSEVIVDINKQLGYSYEIETPETKDAYVSGVNFVNRAEEYGWLKEKIFSLPDRGKMFLLMSSIGLGKSKIFNELKKYCQLNNIIFCECECFKDNVKPYHPVSELLSQIMLYSSRELNNKYHKYLNKVTDYKPFEEETDISVDLYREIEILHQAIINFLLDYGNSTGYTTVIYVNNIQWIDEGSFQILHELLNHISKKENKENKLRIYASARKEESNMIRDRLDGMEKDRCLDIRTLKPFNLSDIMNYFENVFGSCNIDRSLSSSIGKINGRIGGNPYFLGEFIRFSLKERIIDKPGAKWILTEPVEKANVPDNLKDILAKRLYPMLKDQYHLRFMNVFSLIRFSMSYNDIYSFFSGIEKPIIRNRLQELENHEIVKSEKIGNNIFYSLSHELIRKIVSSSIPDRADLHNFIGNKIEAVFRDRIKGYMPELAYHFQEGGDKEKAIYYLKKSGDAQRNKYFNINDILKYYNEALRLSKEFYGKESYETALLYSDIGIIYYEEGDFAAATDNCKIAAEIIKGLYGEESDKFAAVLNRMCLISLKIGEYKKALIFANKANDIQLKIFGDNNIHVARTYNNIAQIYLKTGDYLDALAYARKFQKIYLGIYGQDSREMITPINLMGIVYFDMAELDKAKECFFRAMKLHNIYFGKDAVESTTSYNNIGLVLLEQAHYQEALFYLKKTLKILKAFYKNPHVDIAKCYNNMGIVYHDLKENEKAFKYYRRALRIRRKIYGEMHTRTAGSYNNVGIIYSERGDYKKALKYYKRSLEIQKAIFGQFHASVAKAYNNIGHLYYQMKEYDKAISFISKAMDIRKKVYNNKHTDLASGYHGFASIYRALGDLNKAIEYIHMALEIYLKFYGERHADVGHSYIILSDIFEELNNHEKAYYYIEKATKIYKQVFGVKHINYIEAEDKMRKLESMLN